MLDLDAGKYAAFVWPAFAISAIVIAGMIISALSHARRWRRRAEQLERPEDRP
jgi:heme exporter protein D